LAEENIVKICDFGFAKTMYNNDNYKKKSDKVVRLMRCFFFTKFLYHLIIFQFAGPFASKMDGN